VKKSEYKINSETGPAAAVKRKGHPIPSMTKRREVAEARPERKSTANGGEKKKGGEERLASTRTSPKGAGLREEKDFAGASRRKGLYWHFVRGFVRVGCYRHVGRAFPRKREKLLLNLFFRNFGRIQGELFNKGKGRWHFTSGS